MDQHHPKSYGKANHAPDYEHDHSKDLIIDEGFAVLNDFRLSKPKSNHQPDPIPRYPFASFHNALQVDPKHLPILRDECELVFSARDLEEGDAYSTGVTFFLPAVATPRCALEALVLQIFKAHTTDLIPGQHYDMERSGAEWWTLVLETKGHTTTEGKGKIKNSIEDKKPDPTIVDNEEDENAEIGLHFDADYGLEEQLPHYMLHPRIATITYLTDIGVPTLILEKRSPPPTDTQKLSLDGDITKGWLSCPKSGKHVAFDGRFLHGAPASFFPAVASEAINNVNDDVDDSKQSSKRRRIDENERAYHATTPTGTNIKKRVTLLVNIWINHCPLDAEMLDDELCSQLSPVWSAEDKVSHQNPILWTLPHVNTPDPVPTTTVDVAQASVDEAGVETAILCNHNVVLHFHSSKDVLLSAVHAAKKSESQSLEINFQPGALVLEVGDEAIDEDDDGEENENEVITIDS